MQISINDPVVSTQVFSLLLAAALLLSARKRASREFFSVEITQEMKGFAILAIVLSHIGYFLCADHRFLFPLSILAGVGVDLFLFLSGYGLTASAWKKELAPLEFYRRRLLKLFTPLWMVLGALFLLDFFLLDRSYGAGYMARSFLGIFNHADLYYDVNSPLWYLTFILFFYLLFPLVFRKKYYPLSALLLYVLADRSIASQPAYFASVLHLYELHAMAFPLGVLAAGLVAERQKLGAVTRLLQRIYAGRLVRLLLLLGLACIAGYYAYHSGVGTSPLNQELISLLTAFAFIGLFLFKRVQLRLFSLFGLYSYEIYLFHWPLLYRYDFFYKNLPAWLATACYLVLFLGLGWLLQNAQKNLTLRPLAWRGKRWGRSKVLEKI